MRVLITNNTFGERAGTELYARDVALELLRRGHQPVAYSTMLGEVAEDLRAAGVPVLQSLDVPYEPPDIIHGQHHYETLTAMLRFPQTPAIYYCHGVKPWEEAPLRFPRILRYVAVDELCRLRLIEEGGIDPREIEMIHNFYDDRSFAPRGPLPPTPRMALAFGNDFTEEMGLSVLRAACGRRGIEMHAIGRGAGNSQPSPGPLLAHYDIVFAKGRAAIEAMAVGVAVMIGHFQTMGPMISTGNFDVLRRQNFGLEALTRPLDPDLVAAELERYDAADAMAVAKRVREECGITAAVDRIVQLYERVIDEARRRPLMASMDSEVAVARYLEHWASWYKYTAIREHTLLHQQREICVLRNSATWRWTQTLLRTWPVQRLFGGLIRKVAARSETAAQSSS
jgi:hypothetical protein